MTPEQRSSILDHDERACEGARGRENGDATRLWTGPGVKDGMETAEILGMNYRKEPDGWWWRNPHDLDEWMGPESTKKEAEEARASFKRNWVGILRPGEVVTGKKTA